VQVLADWFESQGDAAADGVRHAIAWARRMGVDPHGLWAEARIGRSAYLMRWIPAGTGVLGSQPGEPERHWKEPVQQRVRLASGYWMGATPVTEGQYAGVMPDGYWPGHGADHPMVAVNRTDLALFLMRENANRQHPVRLPTHAEWEFAARAGTRYPSGQAPGQPLERSCWFGDTAREIPHPVARKAPSPWGLYDMIGNVYAWCADVLAPQNGGRDARCAIRGACWATGRGRMRVAWRGEASVWRRAPATGFRLVLGASTRFTP
jgi:formylglycine-generating enzyme required for sulfatase activity